MAAEHMVDVEVLTPEGEVWSGEARQVSTRSEVGELGILANHAPLLAALRPFWDRPRRLLVMGFILLLFLLTWVRLAAMILVVSTWVVAL